jgi:hypothetical protein
VDIEIGFWTRKLGFYSSQERARAQEPAGKCVAIRVADHQQKAVNQAFHQRVPDQGMSDHLLSLVDRQRCETRWTSSRPDRTCR